MRAHLLAAVVLAGFAATVLPASAAQAPSASSGRRVAIFSEPGFPAADTPAPDARALRSALAGFDVSVLDAVALRAALDGGRVDVLVLPYGSAFPRDAWPSIFRFLSDGGNFVNLGGVPFAVPVVSQGGRWRPATRTPSYHKQIGVVQAFPVAASALTFAPVAEDDPACVMLARDARAARVFELIVRFTATRAFPTEDGSDGVREARLVPLVHGFGTGWLPAAAPFVQIDRLEGRFAGGRWVLATGDGAVPPSAAAALVERAAEGAVEVTVQPRFAGFHPGEPIEATIAVRRPGHAIAAPAQADVQVFDAAGRLAGSAPVSLAASGDRASAQVTLPVDSRALPRGAYRVTASLTGDRAAGPSPAGPGKDTSMRVIRATSGFWIYEQSMLRGGRAVAAQGEYFTRDGVPFPVAGTTYMATDVHRRFLLEPNPWAWRQDFASMARAGVNMVRTGIWTGWSLHSEADGRPTEAASRALEVFLLTARRHDIPVVFNLFAFVPPAWGGGNPYFDPAAVAAQKRFAGGLASRLAGAADVIWDLINEPSFSSPERLWQCRPSYDANEQAAWEAWLRDTVPAPDDASREAVLHDRWNTVAGDRLTLPALQDFRDAHLFGAARPNKAADYRRFAQDAFARWVREMSAAIRTGGDVRQLITVGQDEGGAGERPNPVLFGDDVDFIGTHTWWNNDALLWDGLVSKRTDRPSLIGETGLMTYERPDGTPWRSEEEARNLLERKIALAYAAGATGFIEWLWNTNVYMPLDNEAGIGLLRADGTAKPEVEPLLRIADFLRARPRVFGNRAVEDVAVVVPQSAIFSVRDQGTAATQRAVRTLEYGLRVPVRATSEHAIADLRRGARLLILPSPRILTDAAWAALMNAVDSGATLLVTGPIDRDEYERSVDRLAALGIRAVTRPVAPGNTLIVDPTTRVSVPFRGGQLERIERGVVTGGAAARVAVVPHGKGTLVWCPLPVELSDGDAATEAVYRLALRIARVRPAVTVSSWTQAASAVPTSSAASTEPRARPGAAPAGSAAGAGVLVRPLRFKDAMLFVVVNETDTDADLRVGADGLPSPVRVRVAAERAVMVLVDPKTGKILATTGGQ